MLEAGRLLGVPPTARGLAARPRFAADDEPYRPRRLPRYSVARREGWFSWMSSKYWPTVDDMQRHFDRYDDLLTGFGAQIARDQSIEPFDLVGDHSDDSLQHFRRHFTSWTAGGAAHRHDYVDTRATRAAKMQREWEEIWAKRRAEQQAESDRQWREAEARRENERQRERRLAIKASLAKLGSKVIWRVEIIREGAYQTLSDRAIKDIAVALPQLTCLMCAVECAQGPLGGIVLITEDIPRPVAAVIQPLCQSCANQRENLAWRIVGEVQRCLIER